MLITSTALSAIRTGIQTLFSKGYAAATPELFAERLCTVIQSANASETHVLMETLFNLREWVGARYVRNLVERGFTVANKDYEASFSIKRTDIEDDKLGSYSAGIETLGRAAKLWPNQLCIGAMVAGATSLCYDGQYFFDTDHPLEVQGEAPTVQANRATSTALTAANFSAQYVAMAGILGADGRPLGVTPSHLIVPNALRFTAARIVNSDLVGYLSNNSSTATDSNINKGVCELMVLPDLDGASAIGTSTWYLADLTKPIKPLALQIRRAPDTVSILGSATDEQVFVENVVRVGVDGRGAVAYGLWQLMRRMEA